MLKSGKVITNFKLGDCIENIHLILKQLQFSIMDSNQNDQKLLNEIRLDNLKNEGLNAQLEEAQKENSYLLSILLQRSGDTDISRGYSKSDINSSCSTMSMVHLQYKYEELLANHSGLLKILDLRTTDIRKYQEDNIKLKEELECLKSNLQEYEEKIQRLFKKICVTREKKKYKILRLQKERDSLKIVHQQLVHLLHKQCMEKDRFIINLIRNTSNSEKALLLQEIRKNNILTYETFQQKQEIYYLRSVLNATPSIPKEISNPE